MDCGRDDYHENIINLGNLHAVEQRLFLFVFDFNRAEQGFFWGAL
jgi:hypothetical protein